MNEWIPIVSFALTWLVSIGGFVSWCSKLSVRVAQLETEVKALEARELKVTEDIHSIKVALARIEVLLQTLIKENDKR